MKIFYYIFIFSMINIFPGCVTYYKSGSNTTEDFEAYASKVFIRQNQVLVELMSLSETELDDVQYDRLTEAELNLEDACELLNEYAIREIEGQSMSYYFQHQVKNSVDKCAQSIQFVEDILHEFFNGNHKQGASPMHLNSNNFPQLNAALHNTDLQHKFPQFIVCFYLANHSVKFISK